MHKEEAKKDLLNRLKTLKGHIGGIERMIEEDEDCIDVLVQIAAIKSSIDKVGQAIIEDYAHECIVDSMDEDDDIEEAVKETIKTILKFSK